MAKIRPLRYSKPDKNNVKRRIFTSLLLGAIYFSYRVRIKIKTLLKIPRSYPKKPPLSPLPPPQPILCSKSLVKWWRFYPILHLISPL
jgi:hypothetical protein